MVTTSVSGCFRFRLIVSEPPGGAVGVPGSTAAVFGLLPAELLDTSTPESDKLPLGASVVLCWVLIGDSFRLWLPLSSVI